MNEVSKNARIQSQKHLLNTPTHGHNWTQPDRCVFDKNSCLHKPLVNTEAQVLQKLMYRCPAGYRFTLLTPKNVVF